MALTKISTGVIEADAVDGTKLADNAIDSEHYTDGSADNVHLATGIAASKLTGALPAISGASLTNLPAGGDSRNFIIDGDFTQWTATAATTSVHGSYTGHALTQFRGTNDGSTTWERSTDVPTVAQSSHQSKYSFLIKCTGTDSSIGSNQGVRLYHYITGSDYTHLHSQQVTISFWAKTASANTGDTYYLFLQNSANNRSYVKSFAPTSSWVKYTFTQTMDTTGTWLFTEADKGVQVGICLAGGTDNDDATDGAWGATGSFWASGTAISNFLDSTSNEFYISQFQIVLGSTSPDFKGESVSVVKNQVGYYIQRTDLDQGGDEEFKSGWAVGANTIRIMHWFIPEMRVAPTMSNEAAGNYEMNDGVTIVVGNTIAYATTTTQKTRINIAEAGTSITAGRASVIQRDDTDTAFFMADARH